MGTLKEKITRAVSEYVSLEDTYTYELTRAKSAFSAGTMSLEDFEEWSETNVDKLAEAIVNALQPQLNPNQQRVLNGLQFICNNYSREHRITNGIKYTLRDFYWYLATDYSVLENEMIEHMCKSHELLTADEFSQVLQVFSRWTQEQGDNNETSQTYTFI